MSALFAIDRDGNVTERPRTPAEQRALSLHLSRVYLREAQARRQTPFGATLLKWAGNARREALAINLSPSQPDLFGGAQC